MHNQKRPPFLLELYLQGHARLSCRAGMSGEALSLKGGINGFSEPTHLH